MNGKGHYKYQNGSEYYANYVNNIKGGKGNLKWTNGKIFEGSFIKGKRKQFGK